MKSCLSAAPDEVHVGLAVLSSPLRVFLTQKVLVVHRPTGWDTRTHGPDLTETQKNRFLTDCDF